MKTLTTTKKVLYILAAMFFLLAVIFEFFFIGYLMTALVCLGCAGCLVLFALLSGRDTKRAQRLRVALIVCLIIGGICFLIAEVPILQDARSSEDTSAPYLIVCGAGVNGTKPSLSMIDRLEQALMWLEENPDGVAILSGSQGPNEDISEAQAMYDWLAGEGVDPARLIMEDQADNSLENIANSLDIIESMSGDSAGRVAILSAEYHLHRLGYMAEKLGCEAVLVAAKTSRPSLFINYAVREAFAMWKLWIFGL